MPKKTPPAVTGTIEAEVAFESTRHPTAMSVSDACHHLGVAEVTLMALIERGDIKADRDDDGVVTGVHV